MGGGEDRSARKRSRSPSERKSNKERDETNKGERQSRGDRNTDQKDRRRSRSRDRNNDKVPFIYYVSTCIAQNLLNLTT